MGLQRPLAALALLIALTSCGGQAAEAGYEETAESLVSCEAVRCFAPPACAPDERVIYTPNDCCGTCVGPANDSPFVGRCAGIMCPTLACEPGEQRISSPGSCCGRCVPAP